MVLTRSLRKSDGAALAKSGWRKRRTSLLTTEVAIKLPLDEQIDLETIKQEASLWKQASGHPNVLPIIEANIYADQVVIVSEYVPDGSLADVLKQHGKLSLELATETTVGILAGLTFLHSRRIIHRDLKPDNILLQGATPRLADFGISRLLKTTHTSQTVNIAGTPSYMAPEAFDGKRNVQTDIWSVGVVLYQLLSGYLPFPQQDITSLLGAILRLEPSPLPDSISQTLKTIVARALAKDPDQRYKSASEMREDLRRVNHANEPPVVSPTMKEAVIDSSVVLQPPERETTLQPYLESVRRYEGKEAPNSQLDQNRLAPIPVSKAKRNITLLLGIAVMSLLLVGFGLWVANNWKHESLNPSTQRQAQQSSKAATFNNKLGMPFILLPVGSFLMGSNEADVNAAFADALRTNSGAKREWFTSETPQHQVAIKEGLYLGEFEVTQSQWRAVMGNNPSRFRNCDSCPVEQVSWHDAQEFIKKLNETNDGYQYRLPSEAEWEYACRAGTTTMFAFGDSLNSTQANFNGNYPYADGLTGTWLKKTTTVGSYQPNAWGFYDMHGNVYEWVEDVWADSYNGLSEDGSANTSNGNQAYRVLRGGSWTNHAKYCRSAYRNRVGLDYRYMDSGFRVVAVQKKESVGLFANL